jgi:hypothetical protein
MTMGLRFKSKVAAKAALAERGTLGPEDIIETSVFGREYKDGQHAVCVSLDPYNIRNSFGTITVKNGRIVSVK